MMKPINFYNLRRIILRTSGKHVCLFSARFTSTPTAAKIVQASESNAARPSSYNYRQELVTEDDRLALIGDFVGVDPSPLTVSNAKKKNPFTVIATLQDEWISNRRIKAHIFIRYVLRPLETKAEDFCSQLKRSADLYLPTLIRMCGNAMTDVPMQNRMIILERLIKAFTNNGIKFSMDSVNTMLDVWNQNHHDYNAWVLLEFVKTRLDLQPDAQLFALCAYQLARQGDPAKFAAWEKECRAHGHTPTDEFRRSEIFRAENVRDSALAEQLVDKFISKRGTAAAKSDAHVAALQGAAWCNNMERILEIIDKFMVESEKHYSTPVVGLPQTSQQMLVGLPSEQLLEVLWILTSRHSYDNGRQFIDFATKILSHHQRNTGYFKVMVAHIDRFVVHRFYYTALALLADTNRIRHYLPEQSRVCIRQMLGKIANQMIRNDFPIEKIKEIAEQINIAFSRWPHFYDSLMYSALTHRLSTPEQCLERFLAFVDLADPKRERIHLILPLLVRANTLQSRCKLLYICSSLGYKDFAYLDAHVLFRHVYEPILQDFKLRENYTNVWLGVGDLANRLTAFGISRPEVWRMCYALLKDFTNDQYYNHSDLRELDTWLRHNVHMLKEESDNVATPLKDSVRLTDILGAMKQEFRRTGDIASLTNIAYDLRRRYPNVKAAENFHYDTFAATMSLFHSFSDGPPLTVKNAEEIVQLYTTLIKLDFLRIYEFETFTLRIVFRVLADLGWEEGVKIWLRFQSTFNCSNSIMELFHFALVNTLDEKESEARVNLILHKASNFMPSTRAKALYACILTKLQRVDKAMQLIDKCEPKPSISDYRMGFFLLTAKLKRTDVVRADFLLNLSRLVFKYCDYEKIDFTHTLVNYCNKHKMPLLLWELSEEFKRHRIFVKDHYIRESRRTIAELSQFARLWMSDSGTALLRQSAIVSIVNRRLREISRNFQPFSRNSNHDHREMSP